MRPSLAQDSIQLFCIIRDDSNPIKDGDVVVIDAAGEYAMYASDITRTLPANGKFTARQREIYDIVLGAQQAAVAAFRSGKSNLKRDDPDSLYKVAFDVHQLPWQRQTWRTAGKILHPRAQPLRRAATCTMTMTTPSHWDLDLCSRSNQESTFRKRVWVSASKTFFYVDKDGKLIT